MSNSKVITYFNEKLLIDTNILLLMVVGQSDKNLISRFKRTNTFCEDDYDCLLKLLKNFNQLIVTPNILTEVSNLLGQLSEPKRSQAFITLVTIIKSLFEIYICSQSVSNSRNMIFYGLTDAGIIDLASKNVLILTDDFKLYGKLIASGKSAINFNHLRFS